MNRLWSGAGVWIVCLAGTAIAQQPMPRDPLANRPTALPVTKAATGTRSTSEAASPGYGDSQDEARRARNQALWSHDPDGSLQRAAQYRWEQRVRRIETMKWFGLSNARPHAAVDPIHGDFSPGWTSNSTYYPYRWVGAGQP